MKFVSIKEVVQRIARNHKNMLVDVHDIAEYCYEVVKEYGVYEGFERFAQTVTVTNGKAPMPCNLYKLDTVSYSSSNCADPVPYTEGKDCLNIQMTMPPPTVHVTGLVFKVDDDGHAMIPDTLVTPCYWYCMSNLLIDPVYSGSMPGSTLEDARRMFSDTLHTAKGSLQGISQEEMDNVQKMMRSFVILRPPR